MLARVRPLSWGRRCWRTWSPAQCICVPLREHKCPWLATSELAGTTLLARILAGLAGTHVHFLMGASLQRIAWTIGYQDVIAVGRLFLDGALYTDRVISLAGPAVSQPRLVATRLGADLQALVAGEQDGADARLVSGSVLGGRGVQSDTAYLGRYHQQVSLLQRGQGACLYGVAVTRTHKSTR